MLFRIDSNQDRMAPVEQNWRPRELDLESYLLPTDESDEPILESSVFGEPLLVIQRQVRTRQGKRADILALDRRGRLVIVELKRDRGQLGVETQALQYLAAFSAYRGKQFIEHFSRQIDGFENSVLGFVGNDIPAEELDDEVVSHCCFVESCFLDHEVVSDCCLMDDGLAADCLRVACAKVAADCCLRLRLACDDRWRLIL